MACSVLAGRRYSQGEVKSLLAQAGWPSNLIDTMSAIVMAESSGFACAHNVCGEHSWGLAQVNLDAHRQYTSDQMCDPMQNLRAAYSIYRGRGNFRPWGAYTDGRYRRYAGGGGSAVTPTASVDRGTPDEPLPPAAGSWVIYAAAFVVLVLILRD